MLVFTSAASAQRSVQLSALAAQAAYRFPCVGSHVVVESRVPYRPNERWAGEVVRHARSQCAFAVRCACTLLPVRTTRPVIVVNVVVIFVGRAFDLRVNGAF